MEEQRVEDKSSPFFYIFLFLVFLLGVAAVYFGYRYFVLVKHAQPVTQNSPSPSVVPVKYEYESNPPSQALTGNLSNIAGEVKIQLRDKEDWEEISTPSAIFQGEGLSLNSLALANVNFNGQVELVLGKNSETWFSNLIPQSFLVSQRNGIVTYSVEKPISVRVFDTLSALGQGKFIFNVDPVGETFNMLVASGSATLSFVDFTNETQIYHINQNQTATYYLNNNRMVVK